MRVYLVQHGEARPKDEDPDRRLTDQGVRDVTKMAAFLKPLDLRLAGVWHSGKPRARQTAEILAASVTAEGGVVQREGLAPEDPVRAVRKELLKARQDVMIVGHLPFVARLAAALVTGDDAADIVTFQCGAVLCIECNDDKTATIRWMVPPGVTS